MSVRRSRFQVKPNTRSNSSLTKNDTQQKSPKKENYNPIDAKDKNTGNKQIAAGKVSADETSENETNATPTESPKKDSSSKPTGTDCTPESKVKPPAIRSRLCKPKPKIVPRANLSQSQPEKKGSATDKASESVVNKETDCSAPARISKDLSTKKIPKKTSANINDEADVVSNSTGNVDTDTRMLASEMEVSDKANENISQAIDRSLLMTSFPVVEASTSKSHPTLRDNVQLSEPTKVKKKAPRRFKPGASPPEKKAMKMGDLIFWNPLGNPMSKKSPISANKSPASNRHNSEERDSIDEDEAVDNPDNIQATPETDKPPESTENDVILPGPRVIIGEDGQIMIDESSLVIEQTPTGEDISMQEIVYDASDTTYASFKKPKEKIKSFWTLKETAKFYKTLSIVGTDFTLMSNLFPGRSRIDLKNKFKKEERLRKVLVDKAIREWHNFDLNDVESFLAEDSVEQALLLAEKAKNNKKKTRKTAGKKDENEGEVTTQKRKRRRKNLVNQETKIPRSKKGEPDIRESEVDDKSDNDNADLTNNNEVLEIRTTIGQKRTSDVIKTPHLSEASLENDKSISLGASSHNLEEINQSQDLHTLWVTSSPVTNRPRTLSESTLEYGSPQSGRPKKVKLVQENKDLESYMSDSTIGMPTPLKTTLLDSTENLPNGSLTSDCSTTLKKVQDNRDIEESYMSDSTIGMPTPPKITLLDCTANERNSALNADGSTTHRKGKLLKENGDIEESYMSKSTIGNSTPSNFKNVWEEELDSSECINEIPPATDNQVFLADKENLSNITALATDVSRKLMKIKPVKENSSDEEVYSSESASVIPSPENTVSVGYCSKWLHRNNRGNCTEKENITIKNHEVKNMTNAGDKELPASHPTLNSVLNQISENADSSKENSSTVDFTPDVPTAMGQLILVASRTPTNEQVVHVYLLSPNDETNTTQTENIDHPSGDNESSSMEKEKNNKCKSIVSHSHDSKKPLHSDAGTNQPGASTSGVDSNKTLESLGIVALDSP